MNTMLIIWLLATFLCSFYTLILPAWDSFAEHAAQTNGAKLTHTHTHARAPKAA